MEKLALYGQEFSLIKAEGLCRIEGANNIAYIGSDTVYHLFQKFDKLETAKKGAILFAVTKKSLELTFEFDYSLNPIERDLRISRLHGAEFICSKAR